MYFSTVIKTGKEHQICHLWNFKKKLCVCVHSSLQLNTHLSSHTHTHTTVSSDLFSSWCILCQLVFQHQQCNFVNMSATNKCLTPFCKYSAVYVYIYIHTCVCVCVCVCVISLYDSFLLHLINWLLSDSTVLRCQLDWLHSLTALVSLVHARLL